MVYQGKPSTGCANCRARKIKCDEALPACSQCIKTKRTCPGYVPRFDLVLRDQTKSVRRKAQRKKQNTKATVRSDSTSPDPERSSHQLAASAQFKSFEEFAAPSTFSVTDGSQASSCAVARRSKSADDKLPRMFMEFPQQQAICAFFLDFVLQPRHPDSVRGHLELLLPLYEKAAPDSLLSLATSSVALAISGASHTRKSDQQLARTLFGRALKKTNHAIKDPVICLKDETLMAVLLLGLFERINATAEKEPNPSKMNGAHNAGAAALVMHRGELNCTSPLAIGLLFAVRTQLAEHAIEEGTGFKRCPDTLTELFSRLPQNAAGRLTSVTINIANLRLASKSALLLPRTPESEKEVADLIAYAISIDTLVSVWAESVPAEWRWTAVTSFDTPPNTPSEAFCYNDRKDIYLDLWVMSIWNQYRAARLKIQSIILSCIAWLGPDHEGTWYWRAIFTRMIIQEMADSICASVPFALGTKTFGGAAAAAAVAAAAAGQQHRGDGVIEFPYKAGGPKVSSDHLRAASAVGGWHLLDPLKAGIQAAAGLREGQMEWMEGQMQRIGRIYALQGQGGVGMFERRSYEFPV